MVGHLQGLLLLFTVRIVPVEVRWLTEVVVPVQEPVRYPPLAEDAITPQPLVAEVFPHAETVEVEEWLVLSPVVRNRAYNTMPLHAEAVARQPIVHRAITAVHPHTVPLPVAPAVQAGHSPEAHQAEAEEVDSPVAEEAEAAEEDKSITKCQNADKNINDL